MAEARNLAALSFSLTHDGISVSFDQELLRDIWHKFARSYKRRILVTILYFFGQDVTLKTAYLLKNYVFYYIFGDGFIAKLMSAFVSGALIWFLFAQIFRLSLKMLLSYKGWMYENPHTGKVSAVTKLWFKTLAIISKSEPKLHSFQGSLPRLPLPSLDETLDRHLRSIRPISTDKQYAEMVELTEIFRKGLGRRLQRYLFIKSYLSINYVTDWWEEFVYLRGRSPIMINSNYYGFDTLNENPTKIQAARAANITWSALLFRRLIERQEVSPVLLFFLLT